MTMLPLSVRRVATVARQPSILSSLGPPAPVAVGGFRVAARRHASSQRRYSSSKPSSSDNGSKKVAADSSVTASVERPKTSAEKKKRKAKGAKSPAPALPSVPSTNHLSAPTIALTNFFSLHRPISVTDGFPFTVSDGAFASIFASRPSSHASDVISALSDTVDQLEQPVTKVHIRAKAESDNGSQDLNIYQHVESALPSLFEQLNTMSGKFSPYMSPPAPKPVSQASTAVGGADVDAEATVESVEPETVEATQGNQVVQYKAVITIDQITKANGAVDLIAHPDVFISSAREERLERRRRLGWQAIRWYLISVKRIRKLKMKKKKYKKLMRRTRNERRKLDRL